MGTIRVHEFTSLDWVIETPTWTFDPFDPTMGEAIAEIMGGCRSILLGRHTFERFALAWSERAANDDPGAPFMKDSTKYVVAATSPSVEWNNSTVIGEYDAATIQRLKDQVDGGIYVSGSGTLVRAMLADGLVDELHLFVYPVVLGSGRRLFADSGPPSKLKLLASQTYTSGVVRLSYRPTSS
jgi:dihydrofolate reductase